MHMLKRLKDFKNSFFTINQTELTPFSKLLMTLFFFTTLWLIAAGIGSSVHQSTPPDQKFGYTCTYFANTKHLKITDFEKKRHLHKTFGTAQTCQKLKTAYQNILNDIHIQSEIEQIRLLEQKKARLQRQISQLEKEYSTMLLEKIGNQPQDKSILHANADNALKKLSALRTQGAALQQRIVQKKDLMNYPKLQTFVKLLDRLSDSVKRQYAKERKFYRLRMSAQVFAFVIPIWLLFYALYRYLHQRRKYIFAQLSFYVASAAALYGLVELIHLIYSIIPRVFLAKIIAFFTSHNMIIVLNILGIFLFLGIFGLIIHKVQKNHEKNRAKKDTRILNVKRGSCYNCAAPRKDTDEFCAFCGADLKTECPSCKAKIYRYTLFCTSCGKKVE